MITAICLLLLVGATGKSAQIPLYVWLPTPWKVRRGSALIHAATMVTAGVYMCSRSAALFMKAPIAMDTVAIVGPGYGGDGRDDWPGAERYQESLCVLDGFAAGLHVPGRWAGRFPRLASITL